MKTPPDGGVPKSQTFGPPTPRRSSAVRAPLTIRPLGRSLAAHSNPRIAESRA
jgi:hypothetical protein